MQSMNNFIGDELAVKVKYLSMALNEANKIIEQLEEENRYLSQLLLKLTGEQNEISDKCLV